MHPLAHSLTRPYRGEPEANTSETQGGARGEREEGRGEGRERERAREQRDTGLESVPVGIPRTERSQERARDPRQKTINTDFANSYTPPERRVALVQFAHILRRRD